MDSRISQTASPQTLILGIGNILWADEGFGVRVVEHLFAHYRFPEHVRLMDGGTQGLSLLEHVQQADVLIVIDAVDFGLPPGELVKVAGVDVPRYMGVKKMSLHQAGFEEVLALADLKGQLPAHLFLIGVQPAELEDYGGSLRPLVRAQVAPAAEQALDCLTSLNIPFAKRTQPLAGEQGLTARALSLDHYETERPSEEEAFRQGDLRFLLNR